MTYAEMIQKAARDGRIDLSKEDFGLKLGPDDCEMGVCGNKKEPESRFCAGCYHRFSTAIGRMIEEIDIERADWWKNQ